MQKKILYGNEARIGALNGVRKIVNAVRVTMGAAGRNVLIGRAVYHDGFIKTLPNHVSKDGVTVAHAVELSDVVENRGALLIKEAALKTVEQAGDATTATCVLAGSMIESGLKLVKEGANSQQVKKGIDAAVIEAVRQLKEISTSVKGDNEKIFQVATVSANNDESIGRLVADAFKKIGDDGVIDIEQAEVLETEIKIADGYKFDKGFVSPYFVTNQSKDNCEFEDAIVLLYDKRITHHSQIIDAVKEALKMQKPLLVICEDAADEGLAFFAMNAVQKKFPICVVKAPGFADTKRQGFEDLALYTGATFFSDSKGEDIKKAKHHDFGIAKKIIVTKDETVIIGGGGNPKEIENMLNDLRMNLVDAKTPDEKAPIEKRIATLTGGVAVIRVGAATETEMKEKYDRVDDAVRATKAAIAEGFVPGGGTALLRIENNVFVEGMHPDYWKGWEVVFDSLKAPLMQICDNAGAETQKVLQDVLNAKGTVGFNVLTNKMEDLVEAGIIDSTKAIRCALVNAASVAGMLITSECLIIDEF